MNYVLSIVLLFTTWVLHAEEIYPPGCVPYQVKGERVTLSSSSSSVVMIHNLSNADLWITHPAKKAAANAGWSSLVHAGNWSALALNDKSFVLSCIESRPGHEQQIPCSGVLAICQWANASMPEKMSGTFWAGEDMLLSPLIAYIERRGFVLSPPAQQRD